MVCPICNAENSHLAVICTSCGSFIQSKVDNLDLFATVWQLLESPKSAFRRIAIAEHKNYTVFLSAMMGIGLAFLLMWLLKIGNGDIPLLNILIVGFVFGPFIGISSLLILTFVQKIVAGFLQLKAKFRNTRAIVAYAAVPIVFSVIIILPIEILTFGKYFFSSNPSPYVIKPFSYTVLLTLDGFCIVWSLALYFLGTKVLYNCGPTVAFLVSTVSITVYAGLIWIFVSTIFSRQIEFPIGNTRVIGLTPIPAGHCGLWTG